MNTMLLPRIVAARIHGRERDGRVFGGARAFGDAAIARRWCCSDHFTLFNLDRLPCTTRWRTLNCSS
jgi:hypothetical protein